MARSEGVVAAAIADGGRSYAIVRVPMGGSCAIPLDVTNPSDVSLLTWAFVGFAGSASANPACLMILEGTTEHAFQAGRAITVRAHIRDLTVVLSDHQAGLSDEESALAAEAAIGALSPANAHRFAPVLGLLAPGLDTLVPAPGAPEVGGPDGAGDLTLTPCDFVPEYLLARTRTGYLCMPIDTVRVRSGSPVSAVMTLVSPGDLGKGDPVQGEPSSRDLGRYDRAILIGHGRHVAARIREHRP